MQTATTYGLQEFLEIIGELSQESTKKGLLSRLQKELITLGIALHKNCQRCITLHSSQAKKLEATDWQINHVKKVMFFMEAAPDNSSHLWNDWVANWQDYSYSRINERQQMREMIALAISLVMQDKKQIALHLQAALDAGVSIEKIFEIIPLVLLMDGAPALSQISVLQNCYQEHLKQNTKS